MFQIQYTYFSMWTMFPVISVYKPFYFLVLHIGGQGQYRTWTQYTSIHLWYHTHICRTKYRLSPLNFTTISPHQQKHVTFCFKIHSPLLHSPTSFWFCTLFYAVLKPFLRIFTNVLLLSIWKLSLLKAFMQFS